MDTKPDSDAVPGALFNPLSGWEAASRWNAATFDMVARAWQQWLALLTTLPPQSGIGTFRPTGDLAGRTRDASRPPRESGDPRTGAASSVDSRLRGNDEGQRGSDGPLVVHAHAKGESTGGRRAAKRKPSKRTRG